MFKMRQLLLQKNKKELSEYKAIGMIQEHVSLLYQAIHKNTQDITKLLVRLFPSYRRMDGNLTDMRKKQSLILWVLSMSIMGLENKRKLDNKKNDTYLGLFSMCIFIDTTYFKSFFIYINESLWRFHS